MKRFSRLLEQFFLTVGQNNFGNKIPNLDFLKYYSIFSRQAQNDVAFFVESMTKTYEFTGPWIAFGGSYPGSMVAWAREKYPHLIKGGVSSSGPLLAKVKFI